MSEELVRVQEGKRSVTIKDENYTDGLTFFFCSNGYQSTGVTISRSEIVMLEVALERLRKLADQTCKHTEDS